MAQKPLRHERRINGPAVLALRLAKKLTQAEVATAAGPNEQGKFISIGTISKIESGQLYPSLDIICRLAHGLEVPPAAISHVVDIYVIDDTVRPVGTVVDEHGNAA